MRLLTLLAFVIVGWGSGFGCSSDGAARRADETERLMTSNVAPVTGRERYGADPSLWNGFFDEGSDAELSVSRQGRGNVTKGEEAAVSPPVPPPDDALIGRDGVVVNRDLGDDGMVTLSRSGVSTQESAEVFENRREQDAARRAPRLPAKEEEGWERVLKMFHWDSEFHVDPLLDPYDEDSIWIPYTQGRESRIWVSRP